ncbi:unnamed protein product [Scytosiphon promiscuus]
MHGDEYADEQFEEEDETQSLAGVHWLKGISFDEVELGEQLSGGGVGLIHCGKYQGKRVAIKTLFDRRVEETQKREFQDEVLVLSQLRHPNIVHFFGACLDPPHLFFVMELCQGSLFDLLHHCRRSIGFREQIRMALDVSRAMVYLHSRSPPIVHRDLKSLNLLLLAGKDGPVKICDFGLVRTTNKSAGTPCVMAPELLLERPFNKSVDVYSFGILLWEIITREVPFKGLEASDIVDAVISGGRPTAPGGDWPSGIEQLLSRCWNEDPSQRPTFDELEGLLEDMLQQSRTATTEFKEMENAGDCLDDLLRK